MNLINTKNWKIHLGCSIFTIISIFIVTYLTYIIMSSEYENERFNSSIYKSINTLNSIKEKQILDLKISNSLLVFASINNVNLNKIKPHEYLCAQLDAIDAIAIIDILNSKLNLPEIEKQQFSIKYKKLKQLCTNLKIEG